MKDRSDILFLVTFLFLIPASSHCMFFLLGARLMHRRRLTRKLSADPNRRREERRECEKEHRQRGRVSDTVRQPHYGETRDTYQFHVKYGFRGK